MRHPSSALGIVITLSFAAVVIRPADVEAAGCYNTPSNFCQCIGCGCGGGYHAPLVMGPVTCDRFFARNQVRLPYAPCATCSSGGCNGGSDSPTTMEGFVSSGAAKHGTPRMDRSTAKQNIEHLPVMPKPTVAPIAPTPPNIAEPTTPP